MRPYEAVVVFDTAVEPQAMQASLDRYLEIIRQNDGTVGQIDRWGRRPLAYEIKHKREGYYVVVEFNGLPITISELDRNLRIADEVIRYKIVRLPDHIAGTRSAGAPAVSPS
ncbi:MAG: 30S ribosomal protein S6 [Actinomycetota bacterium]